MAGEGVPSNAPAPTAGEVVAVLASLDATTLAAVLAIVSTPGTVPGIAAMLSPTLQGTREALQISFPSATERFLRQLLI